MNPALPTNFNFMKTVRLFLSFCMMISLTNALFAQTRPAPTPSAQVPQVVDLPFYLVEYDGSSATMNAIRQTQDVTIKHEYQTMSIVAIEASNWAAGHIETMNGVKKIVRDDLFQLNLEESHAQTQALIAQGNGKTGEGCGIAVLDNGIDDRHCMFNGRLRGSGCFSTDIFIPDGFGAGFDLESFSACPRGVSGSTTDATLANTYEVFEFFSDHGSNVAGIAAGASCDGFAFDPAVGGFVPHTSPGGVAPGAHIIPVNVFTRFTSPGFGVVGDFAFCSDILAGLEFVLMNKDQLNVCVVNMSLGGGLSATHCNTDFLANVVDMLSAEGIAVTIATGNGGNSTGIGFPSCIESAVAVGALDDAGDKAVFSDHLDPLVDLMAPGVDITSAISNLTVDPIPTSFFAPFSGTSMATPTVAGAFAILKSACPDATVDDMLSALQDTGAAVPGVATKSIRIQDACELLLSRFNNHIPTLSEWGLMVFSLLILNMSVIFIRRKESILA